MFYESRVAYILDINTKYTRILKDAHKNAICTQIDQEYPNNTFQENTTQFLLNLDIESLNQIRENIIRLMTNYKSIHLNHKQLNTVPLDVLTNIASYLTKAESIQLGYLSIDLYCQTTQKTFILQRRSPTDNDVVEICDSLISSIADDPTSIISYYYPLTVVVNHIDDTKMANFLQPKQHEIVFKQMLSEIQFIECPIHMFTCMPTDMLFNKNLRQVSLLTQFGCYSACDYYHRIAAKFHEYQKINEKAQIKIHELQIKYFFPKDFPILQLLSPNFKKLQLSDGIINIQTISQLKTIFHQQLQSLSLSLAHCNEWDMHEPKWKMVQRINDCPIEQLTIHQENSLQITQRQNIESLFQNGICDNLLYLCVNITFVIRMPKPMNQEYDTLMYYNHKKQRYGWLYELLDSRNNTIQCPSQLKCIVIKTCVCDFNMLMSLSEEILPMTYLINHWNGISTMEIHIKLRNFRSAKFHNSLIKTSTSETVSWDIHQQRVEVTVQHPKQIMRVCQWLEQIAFEHPKISLARKIVVFNF